MDTIIKKSVEGGWYGFSGIGNKPYPKTEAQQKEILRMIYETPKDVAEVFTRHLFQDGVLDPFFWQALFKDKAMENSMTFFGLVMSSEYEWEKAVEWLSNLIKE